MIRAEKHLFIYFISFSYILLVNDSNDNAKVSYLFSLLLYSLSFLCSAFSVYNILKHRIQKEILPLLTITILTSIYMALLSFKEYDVLLGIKRSLLIFVVFSTFFYFYSFESKINLKTLLRCVNYLIKFLFLFFFSHAMLTRKFSTYEGLLQNSNTFGLWASTMLLILIITQNNKNSISLFFISVGMILVYFSTSRTALASLLGSLLIYLVPTRMYKNVWVKHFILGGLFLLSTSIVYLAIEYGSRSNEVIFGFTGKSLMSGRDAAWMAALESLDSPLWGLGTGISLSDISTYDFSLHNFFMQTLLQNGFVGILLISTFFIFLYNLIWKRLNHSYFKPLLGLFVFNFLVQNFEITAFQNNLTLSLPIWAFIGLLLGQSYSSTAKSLMR